MDGFLSELAGRLESAPLVDTEVVRRELARVGERTAGILAAAEESAEALRADAENDSRRRRAEASQQAEEIVAAAEREAVSIVEDALQQRQVLDARIRRLQDRRDAVIAEVERISVELGEAAADANPADAPQSEQLGEGDEESQPAPSSVPAE